MRLVSVQLHQRVEYLAVNESLLFEGLEGLTEIHDDTAFSAALL